MREGKCALSSFHHSLITHSLTYTQTHTYTHSEHIHECWYSLIRALNTRLDASETHLSPCNCVETMLSASANVCMCVGANVIRQVSGQSNPLSNDWFVIWLTGRLPPLLCLLLTFSSFIIHFPTLLSLPAAACIPPFLLHPHTSSYLLLLSVLPPLFNVMFVLHSPLLLSILPPSCLSLDDINTSFCLRCDRITCGNAAQNHSTSAIWMCVRVCVHKLLYTNMYKNTTCMVKVNRNRSTKTFHSVMIALWWPWMFPLELLQSNRAV